MFKEYHLSQFPESLMIQSSPTDFYSDVSDGQRVCESSSVVFCGLCRDVENILPYNIARIEKTRKFFKESSVVIVENDSMDKTKDILSFYASTHKNVEVITPKVKDKNRYDNKGVSAMSVERASLMSNLRNVYLDHIHFKDVDFVVVIDLDMIGGWSYEGFLHSFSTDENWSAMTANGVMLQKLQAKTDEGSFTVKEEMLFFDTWTFRDIGVEKFDGHMMHNSMVFKKGEPLVEVNSNFSGLGIYKFKDLIKCEYRPYSEDEDICCEHVSLHQQMRKNKNKIFLNPSLFTLYSPTEYVL